MSLEIPQYYVLNERSLKTVCNNHQQIKEALRNVDNIIYNEKEQTIVPKLERLYNTVNVQNIDIKEFIQDTSIYSFLQDRVFIVYLKGQKYQQNMNKLVFDQENDARECVD